jgi:hypothetical protein
LIALALTPRQAPAEEDRRPVICVATTFQKSSSNLVLSFITLSGKSSVDDARAVVSRMAAKVLGSMRGIFNFREAQQTGCENTLTLAFDDDDAWPAGESHFSMALAPNVAQVSQITLNPDPPETKKPTQCPLVAGSQRGTPEALSRDLCRAFTDYFTMKADDADRFLSVVPFHAAEVSRKKDTIVTSLKKMHIQLAGNRLAVFKVPSKEVANQLYFKICDILFIAGPFTQGKSANCGDPGAEGLWKPGVKPDPPSIFLHYLSPP